MRVVLPTLSPSGSGWKRDVGSATNARMIVADALQAAGCDNDDILSHCHDANKFHVRGCWALDLLLGKE